MGHDAFAPLGAAVGSIPVGVILKYGGAKFRIQEDRRGTSEICGLACVLSISDLNGRDICMPMHRLIGQGGKDWRRIRSAIYRICRIRFPLLTHGGDGFSFVFFALTAPAGLQSDESLGILRRRKPAFLLKHETHPL